MRRPLNTVWKIPKHLTSHTRAYAYFSNILFNLNTKFISLNTEFIIVSKDLRIVCDLQRIYGASSRENVLYEKIKKVLRNSIEMATFSVLFSIEKTAISIEIRSACSRANPPQLDFRGGSDRDSPALRLYQNLKKYVNLKKKKKNLKPAQVSKNP